MACGQELEEAQRKLQKEADMVLEAGGDRKDFLGGSLGSGKWLMMETWSTQYLQFSLTLAKDEN